MSAIRKARLFAGAPLSAVLLIHVTSCLEPPDTTTPTALTTVDWYWVNPVPTAEGIHDFWGSGRNDVWAVGYEGSIFHYDGSDWVSLP